jgi:hypothetical protein
MLSLLYSCAYVSRHKWLLFRLAACGGPGKKKKFLLSRRRRRQERRKKIFGDTPNPGREAPALLGTPLKGRAQIELYLFSLLPGYRNAKLDMLNALFCTGKLEEIAACDSRKTLLKSP